ncbi:MAG: RHS repeat-associated core domain-containing protein, partial [Acidobacteriota bacterium]
MSQKMLFGAGGLMALDRIRAYESTDKAYHPLILAACSTRKGMSLTEIAHLADKLEMKLQPAKWTAPIQVPVPAMIHWKANHFAALVELVDSSETVRAQYAYDPFGRITKLGGDKDADYRYTGIYYHAPSQLHVTLYRAYDANLGRWISRDPMEEIDGLNLYSYVSNKPINKKDPFGLQGTRVGPGIFVRPVAPVTPGCGCPDAKPIYPGLPFTERDVNPFGQPDIRCWKIPAYPPFVPYPVPENKDICDEILGNCRAWATPRHLPGVIASERLVKYLNVWKRCKAHL